MWVCRSRTYTCWPAGCSGVRLVAAELNATYRPSAEMAGAYASSSEFAPVFPEARETSVVSSLSRSRTKMSLSASRSSRLRFAASDRKAIRRPSAEMLGPAWKLAATALAPFAPLARETRTILSFARSRR